MRLRGDGAYFLANDAVFDLAVAFLNSFRKFNPDIPLCLIPFGDDTERLRGLRTRYGFRIFGRPGILSRCDRIAERIHGHRTGEYRKLAMWEGPFERFVYFDVDTVVLANVDFVFRFLPSRRGPYDFIASQSQLREGRRYVWKSSIARAGILSPKQIRYSAFTGFIASRKGALSVRKTEVALPRAAALIPHMALSYKEQALLNYLVVTSPLSYTSLAVLAAQNPDLEIPVEKWAGGKLGGKPKPLFIHWAGMWQHGLHRKSPIWRRYSRVEGRSGRQR